MSCGVDALATVGESYGTIRASAWGRCESGGASQYLATKALGGIGLRSQGNFVARRRSGYGGKGGRGSPINLRAYARIRQMRLGFIKTRRGGGKTQKGAQGALT